MTLQEALQIFGLSIIIALTKMEGHEMSNLLVSNAIMEKWLDGDIGSIVNENVVSLAQKYGGNTIRQAAPVLANNTQFYGDLKEN